MKEFFKNILGSIDYKELLYKLYVSGIKPKLEKMVAETDNEWDDKAVDALSYLVDKFLAPKAVA